MQEEESNMTLFFFNMNIHQSNDTSIKITVFRRVPLTTDQCFLKTSQYLKAYKHAVVKTLYEQASTIKEETDAQKYLTRTKTQLPPYISQGSLTHTKNNEKWQH